MRTDEFYLSETIDIIEEILSSGGELRIYPKGTSMLPLIVQTRDSVVLRRNTKDAAKMYDVALYRRGNGQFVLHRVMKINKDGTYAMCGDNQTVLENGVKREQIIAFVSKIYREEKEITGSFKHSLYVFLWTKMPIRKFIFFARRVSGKIKRIFKNIFGKRS